MIEWIGFYYGNVAFSNAWNHEVWAPLILLSKNKWMETFIYTKRKKMQRENSQTNE